jgi:hypothetical protein
MYIDLHQLLQAYLNLESLEVPFSKEEIGRTISQLPNDKSLGLMASMESSSKNVGISPLKIFIICVQTFMKKICV